MFSKERGKRHEIQSRECGKDLGGLGVKEKIIRMQFMKNSIFNKRKNKRFLYGEKNDK